MGPDFFHVGHPRSGTGFVYRALAAHPEIFMARKELHGFGADIGFNVPPRSIESYLEHFRGAGFGQRCGDASTWYLASRDAAHEIRSFRPDARIVISLRHPVDMLESLHAHLLANLDENIPDLRKALEAEPARKEGKRIPVGSIPRIALFYRDHLRYAEQVERYLSAFGRDRVHVILFDDLARDAEGTLRDLFRFLQVVPYPEGMEEVLQKGASGRNARWQVRSRRVHAFLKHPYNQAVYAGVREPPVPGWMLFLRALRKLNVRQVQPSGLEAGLRRELLDEVRPQIERLGSLIDRDLSGWMQT